MTHETLYPGLYAAAPGVEEVLAEVAGSTAEKAREIVALREETGRLHADRLAGCAAALARAFAAGGRLFAFGNGGSGTDGHALAELFANPGPGRRPLPALALTSDVAVITALGNDIGFEVVFARRLAALGRAGDIAVGLSTSGDSANVIRALGEAGRMGMITVGFAGYDGGRMRDRVDHLFVVPSSSVHRIQEAQTTLYHVLWEAVQAA
ncbi:phosphoheptose isomerase [Actinomadura craniellae]|uniref:Phosphoheptose isomerase n=1 Tax=Actinomadura craniellae TaxID=2231787 RepID=A0A365H9C8_9ACTN|nr:SIS domain-containing protein [Actinomadura craniellae]RAY15687.1 phosphoheptose isomerase [Actinomadura craniellae]